MADFSASVAGIVEGAAKCEQCGVTIRLANGCCVSCLLKENFEAEVEASAEVFEGVLGEAEVPDKEWRLGNYQVLEEVGRGGMGVIYRARQRHSGRIVALKRVLTYHADSHETLARFRREAEAAASLDHPNILPLYEVSETEDGLPFFSMKFATGGSLRAVATGLRGERREYVMLMAKIARAIEYAHTQGILHRDLQPGNVLLDARGEPLVSDFGLAKWLDGESDLTRTLTTFGTPGYIAPEQASGAEFGPAADIYSLGAILFNLLAGRPPFIGVNALSVIQQAAATPAPKLRSLVPSLDRNLETIVASCLERDPKARYQTAGALAEDLERWLEGRPIIARPVRAPARVFRWSRRNPILASAVAACLLLGLVVGWLLEEKFLAPEAPAPEKSIAVLPFDNLSDEKQSAYFAAGVQDEIISDLARIADLKVISRTSANLYKSGNPRNSREIGLQLGVAHLLEGSVQRIGTRLRVNAQLIETRTDTHTWAQTYDRDVSDLFAVQSEIAQTIAKQMHAKISPMEKLAIERPSTADVSAFDLYSHAKTLTVSISFTAAMQQTLLQAADLLNQAVARDPAFFQAYCLLAYTHDCLYFFGLDHTSARLALAEAAVQAAFKLRPDAGEAHLARAVHLYRGYLDYESALSELEIARQTLPNDPQIFELMGYIQRRQGQLEEGVQNLERALELDPRNVFILQQICLSYHFLRRDRETIAALDRALAIQPDDVETQMARAFAEFHWKADPSRLHQVIDSIRANKPAKLPSVASGWLAGALAERNLVAVKAALEALGDGRFGEDAVRFRRSFGEGLLARMTKDETKARAAFTAARTEQDKIIRAQPDYAPALCVLGVIDAGLGRKEEALRAGRRAMELLPVVKDPINGAHVIEYFAVIAAWVGEQELACEQLEIATRLSGGGLLSYGQLKLSPFWDPLRGDPRFEQIIGSLAPK